MPKPSHAARILAVVLLVCAGTAGAAPPASNAADAAAARRLAEELYTFHLAHDMGFAPETLALRARWLTPELLALAKAYLARPGTADEAPVIDGDPFTNAQDTPKSFTVGGVTVTPSGARVEIGFRWDDGTKTAATLVLRQSARGWLVDDITYPEGSSFRQLLLAPPD